MVLRRVLGSSTLDIAGGCASDVDVAGVGTDLLPSHAPERGGQSPERRECLSCWDHVFSRSHVARRLVILVDVQEGDSLEVGKRFS